MLSVTEGLTQRKSSSMLTNVTAEARIDSIPKLRVHFIRVCAARVIMPSHLLRGVAA